VAAPVERLLAARMRSEVRADHRVELFVEADHRGHCAVRAPDDAVRGCRLVSEKRRKRAGLGGA
jgi:hypothetical protein